jgi:hypothetical protein
MTNTPLDLESLIERSWSSREVKLAEPHGREQLGARTNRTREPRHVITAREGFFEAVYGKVRDVYKGTFESNPAVLLVTEFTFREKRGSITEALVTFTFSPSSLRGGATKEGQQQQPATLAVQLLSPKAIYGTIHHETHNLEYGGTFDAAVNVGPASVGPGVHATKSIEKSVERQLSIHGYEFASGQWDEDVADQAIFKIQRNSATEFPHSVFFGIVVERHEDIEAEVKIEINKRAVGYPWSKEDAPLLLPVGWKGEKVIGTEQCAFQELEEDVWKEIVPYRREGEVSSSSIQMLSLQLTELGRMLWSANRCSECGGSHSILPYPILSRDW